MYQPRPAKNVKVFPTPAQYAVGYAKYKKMLRRDTLVWSTGAVAAVLALIGVAAYAAGY